MSRLPNSRFTISAADAVFDMRLTATEHRVLSALGTYTNEQGWCFPSQATLATRLEVTRQTVSGAIKKLVEFGYLETSVRTSKGRGKVGYDYRVKLDLPKPENADVSLGRCRPPPMSAPADVGAGREPMEAHADIPIRITTPVEQPQPSEAKASSESPEFSLQAEPAPKPAKKPPKPPTYDPRFKAIWEGWPKIGRQRSDKALAYKKWKTGCETWGADEVGAAARYYLASIKAKPDGEDYCCGLQVFMNGKLEGHVEAAKDAKGTKVWSTDLGQFV